MPSPVNGSTHSLLYPFKFFHLIPWIVWVLLGIGHPDHPGPTGNMSLFENSGPFEYFSENGWSQKIKVFLMKERSLPPLSV